MNSDNITMTSNNFSNNGSYSQCVVTIYESINVTLNQNDITSASISSGYGFCIRASNGVDVDANNIYNYMMGIGHIDGVPSSSNIQIRNMDFGPAKELFIGGCMPSCSTTIVKSVSITGNTFDSIIGGRAVNLDHVENFTISDNIFKNHSSGEVLLIWGSDTDGTGGGRGF